MLNRLPSDPRDQAFAQLKKEYERLRSVLDDMAPGVGIVDEKGVVRLINKMGACYLGRSESDCVGQSIKALLPNQADLIMQNVQAVLSTGQPRIGEARIKLHNNTRWLYTTFQPVYGAGEVISSIQILALDVTVQKQAQCDLLNTKRLLDRSQTIAKTGSWEWRLRNGKFTLSAGLRQIYGFEPNEELSVETMISMVHQDDYAVWHEELRQSLENRGPFCLDFRIVRRDGSVAWVNAQSELICTADGKLSKIWCVMQDITERVTAEQQRVELEKQLRQAQKMEAIGTLAGGIAHDFNNILYSIIGFTELVMDDTNPGSLSHENLKEVLAASLRAKELVRHILTFSRHTELQREPITVTTIVKETARMLRATIPATIDLRIEDLSENSTIFGHAAQIQQVILNLCTNAAHAMEDKGGVLHIRLENIVIPPASDSVMSKHVAGPCLKLCVSDTGIGIAPELLERIFDPYMTTKESGKGTGLGLSVVHGIVQSHKGVITVRSRPNLGTTMEIILPVIEKETKAEAIAIPPAYTGNEHILLVDDEHQITNFQKQTLERLGYTVTVHTRGMEAMTSFKAHPDRFHALVTDMTMPDMTGDLLCRQIKSVSPDTPVILCTGYSRKISDESLKTADADLFLMKPVGRVDLARALRQLLDGKKKAPEA